MECVLHAQENHIHTKIKYFKITCVIKIIMQYVRLIAKRITELLGIVKHSLHFKGAATDLCVLRGLTTSFVSI